jgi:hypothetical protein
VVPAPVLARHQHEVRLECAIDIFRWYDPVRDKSTQTYFEGQISVWELRQVLNPVCRLVDLVWEATVACLRVQSTRRVNQYLHRSKDVQRTHRILRSSEIIAETIPCRQVVGN